MAAKFSLNIINPSYESQKNAARLLHFMAAAFISINAVHQLKSHDGDMLICYTELVIAADVFIWSSSALVFCMHYLKWVCSSG